MKAAGGQAWGVRDLRLDFFRGLSLFFIFIDHIPENLLSYFTFRSVAFSDAAEVFIFISGFTAALVYGRSFEENGGLYATAQIYRRVWQLYVAHIFLFVIFTAEVSYTIFVVRNPMFTDEMGVGDFLETPHIAIIRTLFLGFQPNFLDILPLYIVLLMGFPLVLFLLRRNTLLTVALSALLYVGVQLFGWAPRTFPEHHSWFFNPLAWQFLFVFGAWYAAVGAIQLQAVLQSKTAMALALLYLVFGFAVAMSWQFHGLEAMFPQQLVKLIYPIDKSSLSPLRLLHFMALAVVVARLLRHDWSGLMTPGMKALIRCGENSLPIYCLSVPLALLAHVALKEISGGFAMQVAVSLAGIALMIAAATLMTWTAKLDRHGPKLF